MFFVESYELREECVAFEPIMPRNGMIKQNVALLRALANIMDDERRAILAEAM